MTIKAALIALFAAAVAAVPAFAVPSAAKKASSHMLGRQSQNVGIDVLPAPGPITIDGSLDDWDFSGRIWMFADVGVRDRYSAEVAANWDADNLYLAIQWRDPSPMFSDIDPAHNPELGWHADAIQLRLRTDHVAHVTAWHSTPGDVPGMTIARSTDGSKAELVKHLDGVELEGGAAMAHRKDADGQGYVQEIRLPWSLLYKEPPAIKAGLDFRMGIELLWGAPDGRNWPEHRYADNLQPGETSREFFWSNDRVWGSATLRSEGNVTPRQYVPETDQVEGVIPIDIEVPATARRLTLAINAADGTRVRNLISDRDPADFATGQTGENRAVRVMWDGLSDQGQPVEAGHYTVVGLFHDGVTTTLEDTFYNPGTPPWATADGTGGWGADHTPPLRVAASGEGVVLSWSFAEGGSGIIGLGADGRKQWGEKRGALLLAADDKYLYAVPRGWYTGGQSLMRMNAKEGTYAPFRRGEQELPLEYPLDNFFPEGQDTSATVTALAAGDGVVFVGFETGLIAVIDAETAEVHQHLDLGKPVVALAVSEAGDLFASDGKAVFTMNRESGEASPLNLEGLGQATAIALDGDGNLVVADMGPDNQIKRFSPDGELLGTIGRQGGRPLRGKYDPSAVMSVSSVDVDARGRVWVVESTNLPRRVSVWNADGTLHRDYIGGTPYAGSETFLHDTDPDLAYVGPVELERDKSSGEFEVSRILYAPTRPEELPFSIGGRTAHWFSTASFVESDASGESRRYLHYYNRHHLIYMERGDVWMPVAAIGHVSNFRSKDGSHGQLDKELAGLNPRDGLFWTDRNGDGLMQRDEVEIVSAPAEGPTLPLDGYWGTRPDEDLTIWGGHLRWGFDLTGYQPVEFTAEGAPVYAARGMRSLPLREGGDVRPVDDEDLLLMLSFRGYPNDSTGILGIDSTTGQIRWSYPNPFPGVHGSHNATMPRPGLVIGPLMIVGVAEVNDEVGRVFLVRGNLGEDYFFTTDGLHVATTSRDTRLPGEALPGSVEELVGQRMDHFTQGSEPFNGSFVRHRDGVIRMSTGQPGQAGMIQQVHGLETVGRISPLSLHVTEDTLQQVNQALAEREAADEAAQTPVIRRANVTLDPDHRGWQGVDAIRIGDPASPLTATAKLALDETHLFARFAVQDATPWRNLGNDHTRLFKTGDAVDIQLTVDPKIAAAEERTELTSADLRIVLANYRGEPVALLMRPIDPSAGEDVAVEYTSPVMARQFDRVEVLRDARVQLSRGEGSYIVTAAIPTKAIELDKTKGEVTLRGDVGVIHGDATGTTTAARVYWSNRATGLVSDLPQESWLEPAQWSPIVFRFDTD